MGGVVGDAGCRWGVGGAGCRWGVGSEVQVVVWVWGGRAHLRVDMPLYGLTQVVVYISD